MNILSPAYALSSQKQFAPILPLQRLNPALYLFESISAGFPSPADDYHEEQLDLNQLLIRNPAATYCVRVEGFSMQDAGIYDRDILIVDRSLTPRHEDVIVAWLEGECTVKRYEIIKNRHFLVPANKDFLPIEVTNNEQFEVWGVVVHVLHKPYKL